MLEDKKALHDLSLDEKDVQEALREYILKQGFILTGHSIVTPDQMVECEGWKIEDL